MNASLLGADSAKGLPSSNLPTKFGKILYGIFLQVGIPLLCFNSTFSDSISSLYFNFRSVINLKYRLMHLTQSEEYDGAV